MIILFIRGLMLIFLILEVLCFCDEISIKIITLNVRFGKADDGNNSWEFRKDILVNNIKKVNPHIFGVQESFFFQNEYILKSLNSNWNYFGFARYHGVDGLPENHTEFESNGGESCVIFYDSSRFNLVLNGTFWHSNNPDVPSITWGNSIPRITTFGLFEVLNNNEEENKQLLVFNTHFHHERNPYYDIFTTKLMFRKYIEISNFTIPTIIIGDFNIPPFSYVYELFTKTSVNETEIFVDCFEELIQKEKLSIDKFETFVNEPTFHAFEGRIFNETENKCYDFHRIDWILLTKGDFWIRNCYVSYYNEYGKYPSDHFAVVADLVLN